MKIFDAKNFYSLTVTSTGGMNLHTWPLPIILGAVAELKHSGAELWISILYCPDVKKTTLHVWYADDWGSNVGNSTL